MPATADLLRESYRRLVPSLEAAAGRFFDRLSAECPDLAPLLAAARLRGADRELVLALAVVVRNADAPSPLARFLDGLAGRAIDWGVTAEDAAVAREVLLEVLAETAGEEWDAEVESAWAEVLEAAEDRMRNLSRAAASATGQTGAATNLDVTDEAALTAPAPASPPPAGATATRASHRPGSGSPPARRGVRGRGRSRGR